MTKTKTYNRQNLLIVVLVILALSFILVGRLAYLMIAQSVYYGDLARQIHERERPIKAERGRIYDRNGIEIAGNKPVSTISVIHSQIKEPERVIKVLSGELGISEDEVRKRVEKVSSIERIKSNVDKELSDKIRAYKLDGVMVDEDYKRFYPFESLASKVIGFTGSDNQGIIGLEVKYDNYLQGLDGTILTLTTAKGVEIDDAAENRIEPVAGSNLYLSLDINIQKYAEQIATKLLESKEAKSVKMLVMNPQNGELYAMVNVPEFNLNDPYTLPEGTKNPLTEKERNDQLNTMWRNECISDTYEPGSSFKVVTATAALETKSVRLNDSFFCPGYKKVEDRMIRCHKTTGHGSETFVQGIQNSCNPVFMEVGARVGVDGMYKTFRQLGLFQKTGVDLPGEANSIMHNKKNIGAVELATISFGQSFQITPLQLMTAVSTVINGGNRITPHFGVKIESSDEGNIKELSYDTKENMIAKDTSETMKQLLESVVAEGSGHNAFLEGFRIGGKTATSEKLPRSSNKYISSFIGFAPADHPKIIALVLIDEPTGIYYGGTIAAPAVKELFDNVLPYIGIKPDPSIREKTKEAFGQNSNLILY